MRVRFQQSAVRQGRPWPRAGWPLAACLVASMLLCGWPALARTWRVAKDGSGDYSVIQLAVDVASPGDTVFIAAGRYTEHFTTGAWAPPVREACIVVSVDSLTLIGESPETVIVGPETYEYWNYGPVGVGDVSVRYMRVESIGFVNNYIHVQKQGGVPEVSRCRTSGGGHGVALFDCGGGFITSSTFQDGRSGLFANGCQGVLVQGCRFLRCGLPHFDAIQVMVSTDVSVVDCDIEAGFTGIAYNFSTGEVRGCRVGPNDSYGFVASGRGTKLLVEDCTATDSPSPIWVDALAVLTGRRSVFRGTGASVCFRQGEVFLRDCHILNDGGWSVELLDDIRYTPGTYDLTGNWWGTTDSSQIDAWIYDANDEPQVGAVVQYLPFLDGPVPTKAKSWGELKALFH